VKVTTPEGSWLCCRFCSSLDGLKASEVPKVGFKTNAEHTIHLMREHLK
jgi:hypothetical protein